MLLHSNWGKLSLQLQELLRNERENISQELTAQFVAGYDLHIALEEPLFELGKQYLSENELNSMGKIMSNC